jgi:hypothetical protein
LPWLTPAAAYNLIILGTFIATGYASWLLCRSLTTQVTSSRLVADLAGFAGACVFAFSPYQLSQALGHLNLISLEGIPIFILAYIQYLRTNENRYALLLVGSMLYVSLCDYYYLVYLLTFLLFDFCRMAIVHLEDFGFAAEGEAIRLFQQGDTDVSGSLPINPSGGLKACGHPIGATGVKQVFDCFKQLTNIAPNQVKNARTAMAHNMGGVGATCTVHLLATE